MNKVKELDSEYERAIVCARNEKYDEYISILLDLAKKGHKAAQMSLGVAYFQGIGPLEQDYHESLKWHAKAISDDLPENYYWMSLLYDPSLDVERMIPFKSKEKSDYYLEKAVSAMELKALKGDVQAMHRLGELYSIFGSEVYDSEKARHWFDKWRNSKSDS